MERLQWKRQREAHRAGTDVRRCLGYQVLYSLGRKRLKRDRGDMVQTVRNKNNKTLPEVKKPKRAQTEVKKGARLQEVRREVFL